MNRFISFLASMLMTVVALRAQPLTAYNEPNRAAKPVAAKAAESPFFIKVFGIYGLLTPGTRIYNSESLSQSGTVYPFKTSSKGISGGPRAGVGVGLIVNDFINIGIDADLLFGTPVKVEVGYNDGFAKSTTTSITTLKVVSVIPNITFKALSRPSFYIYNRLGLVGGMVLDYKTETNTVNQLTAGTFTTSGVTSDYTKNSLALGYQAALGVQFRLSQSIRAFAEIVAYNQSFKPQRLEKTSTTSSTSAVTVEVTEYKDQGIEIPTTNPTTRKPQTGQQQIFTVPMNSIGVGAGLTVRF
ncbi:hypothetical protein [Spirosoma sp.]|uniref:hypothetical protein n=1 Tax=Spirosoma sp. TaxID=1899569 RepID=UPI003B3BDC24